MATSVTPHPFPGSFTKLIFSNPYFTEAIVIIKDFYENILFLAKFFAIKVKQRKLLPEAPQIQINNQQCP